MEHMGAPEVACLGISRRSSLLLTKGIIQIPPCGPMQGGAIFQVAFQAGTARRPPNLNHRAQRERTTVHTVRAADAFD
jgi:hypothetical protein